LLCAWFAYIRIKLIVGKTSAGLLIRERHHVLGHD